MGQWFGLLRGRAARSAVKSLRLGRVDGIILFARIQFGRGAVSRGRVSGQSFVATAMGQWFGLQRESAANIARMNSLRLGGHVEGGCEKVGDVIEVDVRWRWM
jgi:hypothetical protein